MFVSRIYESNYDETTRTDNIPTFERAMPNTCSQIVAKLFVSFDIFLPGCLGCR